MKTLRLNRQNLIVIMCFLGVALQASGQVELPEIVVTAARYKYLNAVNPEESAQTVDMLEHYTAAFNVKEATFYEDENDNYVINFYIPNGKILAVYDKNGKLLRTAERYNDVALPKNVTNAIAERFPKWSICKDVYLVTYEEKEESIKKIYKVLLQNGDMRMRVKINSNGKFL